MIDLVVVGAGNAALCAALTAAEQGASVVMLEAAPSELRGGNSVHTRNLRCMHEAPMDLLTGVYPEHEYFDDLLRVTGGITDVELARIAIRSSPDVRAWLMRHGVRFQPSLGGTLQLSRTNAFFLGGGKALVNALHRAATALGVTVRYGARVVRLDIVQGSFRALEFECDGRSERLEAKAVVLASGGFESNFEWLREAWGPAADNFRVRGTAYNRGEVLKAVLDCGATRVGDPKQCHAVAIDARAPRYDGGIVTRLDCVSLGIVVNREGQRFYDEGEDFWPKRYAIWGRLVAQQPGQVAYSIIDAKAVGRFMPSVFPAYRADSIAELAQLLELPVERTVEAVRAFNAAVQPGTFDHSALDDCRTSHLVPPKTHWALRIETPPFLGYPLCPGITFTYLGVKVDERARVQFGDSYSNNVFAAGELMAGNILGKGYLAGIGMTIGAVFGRIAGKSAAEHVRH
ncbi:MAG: FAD-dependent tricarballylate dehydrogenase TcuA [Pseudomonadota bacterium]|nr:FAD-dependent tricarballylate dehydrogenase TcuA [Pseudomonadota bacterium]